ncbi:hypothetical protein [Haloferax sp. Atlit-6N]|uniref:hypothetical protein n=1 Tax=Haloferax sp. Atlit-6N TaxID=2077205 RepID=UPI0011C08221|nr:hypothetical protein [Haloferax sp. Atlit-6N]
MVLAGCATTPPAQSTSTPPPECVTTPEYERQPVPDLPMTVTRESAKRFAKTHAEALVWNDKYKSADTGLEVNGDASIVNEIPEGYIVHVSGGMTYYTCENGHLGVADGGFHANYFINDSTALRLNRPTNRTDDPREHNGEPVA